jgi:hypothetical protein
MVVNGIYSYNNKKMDTKVISKLSELSKEEIEEL